MFFGLFDQLFPLMFTAVFLFHCRHIHLHCRYRVQHMA